MAFDVNQAEYYIVNNALSRQVMETGRILETLNAVLRNIDAAVQGQGAVVWKEEQLMWNAQYNTMAERLNGTTTSSFRVANIFDEGDTQGARIMYSST